MTLYQLQLLIAVEDYGSISQAASQWDITQPTVSHQLQLLEQELGFPLLQRRSRGMVLTRAGTLVSSSAREILRLAEAIPQKLNAMQTVIHGAVSLGLSPVSAVSTNHFPAIYQSFHQKFPEVQISVIEQSSVPTIDALHHGTINVAIMSLPVLGSRVDIQPLWDEELVVIAPKDLDISHTVSLPDLQSLPWVLFRSTFGLARTVTAFCHNAGFDPRCVAQASSIGTIIGFVSAGMGISIIPRDVGVEYAQRQHLKIIPLNTPLTRRIALVSVSGKTLSPAAEALAQEILSYADHHTYSDEA